MRAAYNSISFQLVFVYQSPEQCTNIRWLIIKTILARRLNGIAHTPR